MKSITESEKRIPVVREVDVVIAGSGISGLFAALGAAKTGARTLLVDRFGTIGGNMGPAGFIVGGKLARDFELSIATNRFPNIIATFFDRYEAMLAEQPVNYATMSHTAAQVAFEMMEELGVETMLSAYATDPIMEDDRAVGLYVETTSGRVAVRAKVVIDATGTAALASRAGAPVRHDVSAAEMDSPNMGANYLNPEEIRHDDTLLLAVVAGVDYVAYNDWRRGAGPTYRDRDHGLLTPAELAWAKEHISNIYAKRERPDALIALYKKAWESGEFRFTRKLRKNPRVAFGRWSVPVHYLSPGLMGVEVSCVGDFDSGSWEDVSMMEQAMRRMAYDGVQFFKKRVPGFRDAYILTIPPFLGSRGGPFIEAEHVLTPQESNRGFQPADSVCLTKVEAMFRGGSKKGHGMPYRMLLPKVVDGMLVTGRGAGFLRRGHDPCTRVRSNMMSFGTATGIAAAMAVASNTTPRDLDVKKLLRRLLKEGFYLGSQSRLKRLKLV